MQSCFRHSSSAVGRQLHPRKSWRTHKKRCSGILIMIIRQHITPQPYNESVHLDGIPRESCEIDWNHYGKIGNQIESEQRKRPADG